MTSRASFVLAWALFASAIAPASQADPESARTAEPARPHPATVGVGLELNRALRQSRARILSPAECTAEIARLGSGALPSALAILEERAIPAIDDADGVSERASAKSSDKTSDKSLEHASERQILSEPQEAQVLDALRVLPSSAVVDAARLHLAQRGGARAPLWARLAVVEAVGTCGGYSNVSWLCELFAGASIDRAAERVLSMSLHDILSRDRDGFASLAFDWRRLPRPVLASVVTAAGADGDPRALPVLTEVLAQSPELAPLALAGIARQHVPAEVPRALLDELRARLSEDQPMPCRAACTALAALGDYGSVAPMIALLAAQDEGLRSTAHQALQALSGMMLPAEPSGWKCWFESERSWFAARGPAITIALETGRDREAMDALAELAEHRWERHRMSQLAAGVLARHDRVVRLRTCQVLRMLASPRAREPLNALIDDRDAEVAAAARSALEALPSASAPRK